MNEENYMFLQEFLKLQVPVKYKHASLETCNLLPKHYIEFGKKWAENPTSIVLIGGYGSGKTFYAFALIRELLRTNLKIWPRYFTSADFDIRLLHASKSEEGEMHEIHERSREDLLFIDDLGREMRSERLRRQYFQIFNHRYSHLLPTIITSNYNLDQLGELLDGSISSRMQTWHLIEFEKVDLRNDGERSRIQEIK